MAMDRMTNNFCDLIHLINHDFALQPCFYVAILEDKHIIRALSNNWEELGLGSKETLLDQPLDKLDPKHAHKLKERLSQHEVRYYQPFLKREHYTIWLRTKTMDSFTLLEFETVDKKPLIQDFSVLLESYSHMIRERAKLPTEKQLLEHLISIIFKALHFDVVRAYQFNQDCTGMVVAEKKIQSVASYEGYYFPETDVPLPVRKLFHDILYRYLPDIEAEQVRMSGQNDAFNELLLRADGRALAGVHYDYLKNMKAKAAFTVPVIIDDALWGLIACQHKTANYIHPQDRFYCRLLVEYFVLSKVMIEQETKREKNLLMLAEYSKLHSSTPKTKSLDQFFGHKKNNLLNMMDAAGFVCFLDDSYYTSGTHPSKDEVNELIRWLGRKKFLEFYYCDDLPLQFLKVKRFKHRFCGLFAISLSLTKPYYLLFFRDEYISTITWAGNPKEALNKSTNDDYSPRSSFNAWQEQVANHSKPWSSESIKYAEIIKRILMDKWVQLKFYEQSFTDGLTKAYNRHFLNDYVKKFEKNRRNEKRVFCVSMLDIDNFKRLNDEYGHAFGDEVLSIIADLIKQHLRKTDLVIRYGGEEFLVVLNGCDDSQGQKLITKVLNAIRTYRFYSTSGTLVHVTISAGITSSQAADKKLMALIRQADKALYQAKSTGKDQLVNFNEL
ncbi:sensor domain-containing diguanylate cyclase [Legionella yabuuchiae]|uniref:sensor domain-containing diguanylate cyclase n=1 Tax=Legionella yabuuchiae TaxID=376727 RepID=UPI0010561649|nr:sensor domain-containing diguanylate cyclase [Legionella yabuuchiae]